MKIHKHNNKNTILIEFYFYIRFEYTVKPA